MYGSWKRVEQSLTNISTKEGLKPTTTIILSLLLSRETNEFSINSKKGKENFWKWFPPSFERSFSRRREITGGYSSSPRNCPANGAGRQISAVISLRSNFSTGPLFLINWRGTGWRPSRSIDRSPASFPSRGTTRRLPVLGTLPLSGWMFPSRGGRMRFHSPLLCYSVCLKVDGDGFFFFQKELKKNWNKTFNEIRSNKIINKSYVVVVFRVELSNFWM